MTNGLLGVCFFKYFKMCDKKEIKNTKNYSLPHPVIFVQIHWGVGDCCITVCDIVTITVHRMKGQRRRRRRRRRGNVVFRDIVVKNHIEDFLNQGYIFLNLSSKNLVVIFRFTSHPGLHFRIL